MRFHRILLRDYRAIRSCTIEPLPGGITVIEGDNEVGKSSIAEALWLVFEQHDDSQGAAVRAIRPADRDAATEIEVDVSSGPYRFTYFKRFHRSPKTELRVSEPAAEVLAGREAHDRALAILDETMDRRLWDALRIQQGGSLDPVVAGQHHSLLRALDIAAGQLLGGDREKSLFERAQAEFERYFTATGRERTAKDGVDAARLRQARDLSRAEYERLRTLIASHEKSALRCDELDRALSRLDAESKLAGVRHEQLAEVDRRWKDCQANVVRLDTDAREADADEREATRALRTRSQVIEAAGPRARAIAEDRARLQELAGLLADAARREEGADQAVEDARRELAEARAALQVAEDDLRLLDQELQATQMSERLERLADNEPALRELGAWLNACRVDRAVLHELENAEREMALIAARRDAAGASFTIEAPSGTRIDVDGEAHTSEGAPFEATVVGETVLRLPGDIVVRIQAGRQARELDTAAAAAAVRLREALAAAGAADLDAARRAYDERVQKEERRKSLANQVQADLRDISTTELRAKLERSRARIAEARAARPPGVSVPDSVDAARAQQQSLNSRVTAKTQAERGALTVLEGVRAKRSALEREKAELDGGVRAASAELDRLDAELSLARQAEPDDALAKRAAEARTKLDRVKQARDAAVAELELTPRPTDELATVARDQSRIAADVRNAELERAGLQKVLEDAGAAGVHHQLSDAETRSEAALAELDSFLRRAAAARTLFDTLNRRRNEARENYAGPLRARIEALGRPVFDPSFSVELADDLAIARRTSRGVTLEFHQLSVGTREQLSVLMRLACASLVSEEGGAPLILDDIFGWADPGRLRRLAPVLAEAARDLQVLLFTCTPARFESIAPARVVSLPGGETRDRGAAEPGAEQAQAAKPTLSAAPAPQASPRPGGPAPQGTLDLFSPPPAEPAGRR